MYNYFDTVTHDNVELDTKNIHLLLKPRGQNYFTDQFLGEKPDFEKDLIDVAKKIY